MEQFFATRDCFLFFIYSTTLREQGRKAFSFSLYRAKKQRRGTRRRKLPKEEEQGEEKRNLISIVHISKEKAENFLEKIKKYFFYKIFSAFSVLK